MTGEKRGRGRPRKEPPPAATQPGSEPAPKASPLKDVIENGLPWFREGDVLSETEAKALYEPLKAALGDYCDYLDEYIWYREQHARGDEPVWSDIDDDELNAITRIMLKRAKRSAAAATITRAIVNGDDYATAIVFGVQRVVKMQGRLRAAPKREKRARRA